MYTQDSGQGPDGGMYLQSALKIELEGDILVMTILQ